MSEESEELTKEQLYQRSYYQEHRAARAARHKKRWAENTEYREREIDRQRKRRQESREASVQDRFDRRVDEKREAARPTRRPQYVEIDGERTYVYGVGSFAREVGREDATIRSWLVHSVLPGASIWIGRRAHFTKEFVSAVRSACRAMLTKDGRGCNEELGNLIRAELDKRGIKYTAKRG